MLVENAHQHTIGMGEIVELVAQLVGPFGSVEEVVPEPPDDHQKRKHVITWGVARPLDHGLYDLRTVTGTKIQVRKVNGQLAIGEIAMPEIGKLVGEWAGVQHTNVDPVVYHVTDRAGLRKAAL